VDAILDPGQRIIQTGVNWAYYYWRPSYVDPDPQPPDLSIWRVIPFPFVARVFEAYDDNGSVRLGPAGPGVAINYQDLAPALKGRVAPQPGEINEAMDMIALTSDALSVAKAYWAPMPNAPPPPFWPPSDFWGGLGITCPSCVSIADAENSITYYSILSGATLMSAQVVGRDGTTSRNLPSGGLSLTADKEISLTIINPFSFETWLRIEQLGFAAADGSRTASSDPAVFDLSKLNVVTDSEGGPWLRVAASETSTITLPLNPNSNGADIRFTLAYSRTLGPDYCPGLPLYDQEAVILETLNFRVANLRLQKANFFDRDILSPWQYNKSYLQIDANREVEYPEYWQHHRYSKPLHLLYGDSVVSPTAIPLAKPLYLGATFSCQGIDSWAVSLECVEKNSEGPVICPYGDFLNWIITCGPNGENNPFNSIMYSSNYPNSVMATMNHYRWKVSEIHYGSNILSGSEITIEDTYHRFYTTIDDPEPISRENPNSWVALMEFSTHLAEGVTSCDRARYNMVRAIYENHYVDHVNDIYFFRANGLPINYTGERHYHSKPFYRYFLIGGLGAEYFDLTLLIEDITSSIQKVSMDCYENAMFNNMLNRSLGCYMGLERITYITEDFWTRCILPQESPNPPNKVLWGSHFYPIFFNKIYDSSLALSFFEDEVPENYCTPTVPDTCIDNFDCYFLSTGVDDQYYLEHLLHDYSLTLIRQYNFIKEIK